MKWAFIPLEGITLEESRSAFFVLQSPSSGTYDPKKDLFINRFWKREEAINYFNKL